MVSDEGAEFDRVVVLDGAQVEPQVTWGTSPEMVLPVSGSIPDPKLELDPTKQGNIEQNAINNEDIEAGEDFQSNLTAAGISRGSGTAYETNFDDFGN